MKAKYEKEKWIMKNIKNIEEWLLWKWKMKIMAKANEKPILTSNSNVSDQWQ